MTGGFDLVIVGGSYAGATLALAARETGFSGSILIVSCEQHLPYHRPPLSKAALKGSEPPECLPLHPEAFYRENRIDILQPAEVVAINRDRSTVGLASGEVLEYRQLALTTGAGPNRLRVPGADLSGVHYLRSLEDAAGIWQAIRAKQPLVVVGAGYIGLEIAASLAEAGLKVTVVDVASRPLMRTASAELAAFLLARHRQAGVEFLFECGVAEIKGGDGSVSAVALSDGTVLPADVVVIGIGVSPHVEIARAAGLECRNGILVGADCRTNDPAILAAGDCANFYSARLGRHVRLESVQNAFAQATIAGEVVTGKHGAYDPVPWFWSDQYDLKIQIAGLIDDLDEVILRGDPQSGRFSFIHLARSRIAAIESINNAKDHMIGRRIVGAKVSGERARLADPKFDLKQLI